MKSCESVPDEFVALIVNLKVFAAVGVPEISPVEVFNSSPVGNDPLSKFHVIGVSPNASSVYE